MTNDFKTFEFNLNPFRALDLLGHPWFVAKDAAQILNYPKPMEAVAMFCKGSGVYTQHTTAGDRTYTIIHLIDLETLGSHSLLPNKDTFLDLVRNRVVPQICPPKPWVIDADAEPMAFQVLPLEAVQTPSFELVTLKRGEAFTTTLAIAQGTANEHASVLLLVRKYQEDLGEFGLLDFKSESSGGRPTEYALLNEQQATLLLTYMRNSDIVRDFKKRLVKAFWELTRRSAAGPQVPQTLPEALRFAADQAERREALECKVAALEPKADFHDHVAATGAKDAISVSEMAKLLNAGPVRFFRWLKEEKILMSFGRQENLPYQSHLDAGYFIVKEGCHGSPSGEPKTHRQALVTGKGQIWLQKRYAKVLA